ncbi:hypothetical protein D3C85_660360 [compost metagenome]
MLPEGWRQAELLPAQVQLQRSDLGAAGAVALLQVEALQADTAERQACPLPVELANRVALEQAQPAVVAVTAKQHQQQEQADDSQPGTPADHGYISIVLICCLDVNPRARGCQSAAASRGKAACPLVSKGRVYSTCNGAGFDKLPA